MNSGVESNRFARDVIQHKSGYRLHFEKAVVFRLDGVFERRLHICRNSGFQGGVHSSLGIPIWDAIYLAFKLLPSTGKAT